MKLQINYSQYNEKSNAEISNDLVLGEFFSHFPLSLTYAACSRDNNPWKFQSCFLYFSIFIIAIPRVKGRVQTEKEIAVSRGQSQL